MIEKLGMPGVVLTGLYWFGCWLRPHADRLWTAHLGLVDALEKTQPRTAADLAEIKQKTAEIHEVVVVQKE